MYGASDALIPPPPAPAASTSNVEVISLGAKIPDFWTAHPRLWFAQFESIMAPQRKGDEDKFHLVISKLGLDALQQVSDILTTPPSTNKYSTVKERLIGSFEESESRQFQKLVSEMELGDQKPSQLLRKMRDLAKKKVPDETLQIMWCGHLPPSVRAVLSISDVKDLDRLAQIADTVMENIRPQHEVAQVSRPDITLLTQKLDQLTLEVAELKRGQGQNQQRGRSPFRRFGSYRSQSRSNSHSGRWMCYYHRKFGQKATKCGNNNKCTFKAVQAEN
jgi:hypothetical protein